MEAKSTDVISRLESAVTAWSEELQSAHLDLERRLADAATKLAHDVEGGLLDSGPVLEALEASQDRLDEVHAAIGDVVTHVGEMEQRLSAVESPAEDREKIERKVAELVERVNKITSKGDWKPELNELREEIAALRSQPSGGGADLEELRGELQALREQVNNQKPTDDALVAEFAKVGMEVSQLRSALKEIGLSASAAASGPSESDVEVFDLSNAQAENGFEAPTDEDVFTDSTEEQVESLNVTDDALRRLAFDENGHRRRLGDILTAASAITSGQLDEALERQSRIPTSRIGTILVELGAATELTIARVLSAQLQIPYVDLHEDSISDQAVSLMNPRLARNHQCIPVKVAGDTMTLAMANPLDLIAIEDVELATHKRVDPVVATQSQVAHLIEQFYGPKVEIDQAVADLDEV